MGQNRNKKYQIRVNVFTLIGKYMSNNTKTKSKFSF